MLITGVLVPVVLNPERRRMLAGVAPRYRVGVMGMLGCSLAGHLWLGSRTFPFVDWSMYTFPVSGDPVVVEYDAVLSSGATVPLSPSGFLAPHSAGRLMEGLRRQVMRVQALPEGRGRSALMRQHEEALRAIASRLTARQADEAIERVVVSESVVELGSGVRRPVRVLWEVALE